MARFPIQFQSTDRRGRLIIGATITLTETGGSVVAIAYEASTGGSAIPNGQLTSDSDGRVKFWVDEADYGSNQFFRVTLTGPSFVTQIVDDVVVIPNVTGGHADITLDNLAAVAINTSLVSDTHDTDDLGTEAIAWKKLYLGSGGISLEGSTDNDFQTTINVTDPTADNTWTVPDATDTAVGKATTDAFTNKSFDANGTGNSLSNVDIADLANGTDGELITWDANAAPAAVAVGTVGQVLTSGGAGVAPTFQASSGGGGVKNLLINGDMRISQRGTSFTGGTTNADDVYTLDRWNLLSDGSDIVDVTQSTEVPTGALNSIGLDVETASKKFGIIQILEQKDAERIIGGTVTLSFKAKVTSAAAGRLDNVKAVVLSWDSTADTVTSDVISAWGVEDTTPTFATNWTSENTPVNLNVTATWASYSITGISIDTSSAKNVAVFIWADGLTGTVTDFLNITDIQLESGSSASDFEIRDIATELGMCKRYFEKLNSQGIATYQFSGMVQAISTTNARLIYIFGIEKRTSPTLAISTAGDFQVVQADNTAENVTVLSLSQPTPFTFIGSITVAGNLIAGNTSRIFDDSAGNAFMSANAEL